MNQTVKYQGAFSRIVGFADKCFLFSPPIPLHLIFCSRSNFHAMTRLEMLATQTKKSVINMLYYGHQSLGLYSNFQEKQ